MGWMTSSVPYVPFGVDNESRRLSSSVLAMIGPVDSGLAPGIPTDGADPMDNPLAAGNDADRIAKPVVTTATVTNSAPIGARPRARARRTGSWRNPVAAAALERSRH